MPRVQKRPSYATLLQKSYPDSYVMTDTQSWHSLFDSERTRVPITRIRFPLRLSHGSSLPQAPTFMFPLQRLFSATNALLFCPFPRFPVSQQIWTPRFGPPGSISAGGYGPWGPYPLADLDRGSNSRGVQIR